MNPSLSSKSSSESVPTINTTSRNATGPVRSAHRPRPSPMATTQRAMRKNSDQSQPVRRLSMALHPYPVASTSARRIEDLPRPQAGQQPVAYMRPALSPVSPVFNSTLNYIDTTFRGCAERIQVELTNLRSACSKAVFREQQEKERWRTQCMALQKECVAARAQVQLIQRVSARHHEMQLAAEEKGKSPIGSPPVSAPAALGSSSGSVSPTRARPLSDIFAPHPPASALPEEPPASADVDSDSEELGISQTLLYPSPRNSPRDATFGNPLRYQRCRSLPAHLDPAELKLSPRSQLFPPGSIARNADNVGSPTMVAIPFIDPLAGPTFAEPPSSASVAGFRRPSNAGSEASTSSTCIESDDESANIPISKHHRSASSSSSSSSSSNLQIPALLPPLAAPVEEIKPAVAMVKAEPEDVAIPLTPNHPPLLHVDLMYISKSDQLHCRACMLSKSKSPGPTNTARVTFPLSASWETLRDHCVKEHPKESAEVSALQPAELYALRLKLYQHQQSMGVY